MIGQTLGHYRIVEKIGAGGMGEVYRAHDQRLERDVALKVLPAGTLADETARKRFRKEALALSKLNHPHIATVHDFDTQDGVDFLVMEYVPGPSLAETLADGAVAEKEVVRLGAQMASALEEAHGQGVVHRDLKPGNVVLTARGDAKVLDFGLAKLVQPVAEVATADSLSETQAGAGTLPYMAPEQLRGEAVDARTDIYAAGVLLYEMATGQRPFQAQLGTALAADIQHKQPAPPKQINSSISTRLDDAILKCLEKNPEHRYQSARDLLVDFRRSEAPAQPHHPRPRTRWWPIAAVGVVIVLAVLIGLNVGGLRQRLIGGVEPGPITSIAVLPLDNLMGETEQEYFVEGMHEALVTDLSRIRALKVISRTSAMRYQDTDKPIPEIARELGVDAVVEGSVLRVGNQVRITAQLIHAATDEHLWAEAYERDLTNILVLQREVARAIARQINIAVTPEEQARLASARPVNPEAHEAYLKGRYYWNKRGNEDIKKGLEYFQHAIERDPGYAPAYVGLADSYLVASDWGFLPPEQAIPRARTAVLKALEIDDARGEAHASLASIKYMYDWDWLGAEKEFKRAIALVPGYATARQWYALLLSNLGRHEEAIAEIKRAQKLDPLSLIIKVNVGVDFYFARQYDQAIQQCRETIEMDPNFPLGHYYLGAANEQKAMFEEAIANFEKAASVSGDASYAVAGLGHAYALAGRKTEAHTVLGKLEGLRRRHVSLYSMALINVGLGEKEQALEWLEKAYEERGSGLRSLKVDPRLDPLRSDPRFQSLLRRMNFPK